MSIFKILSNSLGFQCFIWHLMNLLQCMLDIFIVQNWNKTQRINKKSIPPCSGLPVPNIIKWVVLIQTTYILIGTLLMSCTHFLSMALPVNPVCEMTNTSTTRYCTSLCYLQDMFLQTCLMWSRCDKICSIETPSFLDPAFPTLQKPITKSFRCHSSIFSSINLCNICIST